MEIRPATFEDYPKLSAFDDFTGDRRIDMQRGEIYVCDSPDESAVGYLRLSSNHFFDWPLVVSLSVKEDFRRCGFGMGLLRYVIELKHLPRVYVSTENGNSAMRQLLLHIGADEIGYIDKLNFDNERELIYRLK